MAGVNINSKLPNTGISIFAVMSKMAEEFNAINLSQGFPDFNCSEELTDLVTFYQKKGYNQYAPMPGVPVLRKKITDKIGKLYGREYNPDTELVITAGATQAIFTAISCIVRKGDEVILYEPAYDSYAPSVILNGGIPLFIPLKTDDYSIDWTLTKEKISSKTKMIIINSPHNPTGSVINMADIKNLEEITAGKNIIILSDEVYEHITFDKHPHYSLSYSNELAKKSFIISSFGKTFHTTGWKIGYCAAPKYLMDEFKKVHQFIVFAVNTPIQYAYADYLSNEKHYLELNCFYEKKRDLIIDLLKKSRFKISPAKGTYFQLLDYSEISGKNDMEFSEFLTKDAGVAVIPLSPFYQSGNSNKIIRICFAKQDEILIKAAERLIKV